MPTGVVKWFNLEKGFGFISQPDGLDVFVHYSAVQLPGYRLLDVGQRVQFEVEEGPNGPRAVDVRPQ